MSKQKDKNPNYKVILYSFIALYCLYLTYTVDWLFIAISALMMWLNHRELFKK